MKEIKEKCLIIDGNNLLYRCYHASQHLPWESEVKAVFIFLRVMISLLKENSYQRLLVAFDSTKTNFRHNIFPQYKINRLVAPSSFLCQLNVLQELLVKTKVVLIKLENFEADDLIASFVLQNSTNPDVIFDILSQDKDLLQLLSLQVNICKYSDKQVIVYRYADFLQEYGFSPSNYIDYLSLMGDKADNIDGVEGIGKKKARQLIQRFGTTENIYQNINNLSEGLQKFLKEKKETVIQNKQLIELKKDLILPVSWGKCAFDWEKWKNNQELRGFCQDHQFNSILKLFSE